MYKYRTVDNIFSGFNSLFEQLSDTGTLVWDKQDFIQISDNKAVIETPGANKENLEVSHKYGHISLTWKVGDKPKVKTFILPKGMEPTEVEVKDGIATISFAANEKKILVK